jgi:DNA modification methylase
MIELYKGYCLIEMQKIPDNSIDAIITDPPYGTTACKWDSVIPFNLMWKELNRVIKPNGAIVLFGSEPFSSALRMSNIKNYKDDWVWDKMQGGNFLNAKKQPLRKYENISVFYKKQPNYNPQLIDKDLSKVREVGQRDSFKGGYIGKTNGRLSRDYNNKKSYPTDILQYSSRGKECNTKHREHPTQKPVELMEYLIKTYTNENETVLDFTMGSGSTGVACVNTNRNFIGIEQDENYFNIAKERINP